MSVAPTTYASGHWQAPQRRRHALRRRRRHGDARRRVGARPRRGPGDLPWGRCRGGSPGLVPSCPRDPHTLGHPAHPGPRRGPGSRRSDRRGLRALRGHRRARRRPLPRRGRARCLEFSIGDYVLNGGEVAAMVFIEAVARLLDGFMGNPDSLVEESHSGAGLLEYPVFTKPREFRSFEVPEVLLGGPHGHRAVATRPRDRKDRAVRPDIALSSMRRLAWRAPIVRLGLLRCRLPASGRGGAARGATGSA